VQFVVGYDLSKFKMYYRELATDPEWRRTDGFSEELGKEWERRLTENPSQLIVWVDDNGDIVGHAIWHESNTEEHRKGDSRDEDDREILRGFFGGERDFVELHEVWLTQAHRGKGIGTEFFEFYLNFTRRKGYDSIVYYADHPAAIAICRKLGCKESRLRFADRDWHVFLLTT
jgi:GNAT superfamily N-acetyltransferase